MSASEKIELYLYRTAKIFAEKSQNESTFGEYVRKVYIIAIIFKKQTDLVSFYFLF